MIQYISSYLALCDVPFLDDSININKISLIQAVESLGCYFPISDHLILYTL